MRKFLILGYLLAAICLYYAFRGISFHELGESFQKAQWQWILLALGVYTLGYMLRCVRWAVLLRTLLPVRPQQLYWPLIIGFFANNVLPLRMGELVRAHISGSQLKISRVSTLGTIVVERLCDTLCFLILFVFVTMTHSFPGLIDKGAKTLGVLCLVAIAGLVSILKNEQRFLSLLRRTRLPPLWKDKIEGIMGHFLKSISGITQVQYVAKALFLSLLIWAVEAGFLFLIAKAFLVPLLYAQALFLLFVLGLSVSMPQAPGYVGTIEFFGAMALTSLGIPKDQALSMILAVHGIQFVYISVLGCLGLWRTGLSLGSLKSVK